MGFRISLTWTGTEADDRWDQDAFITARAEPYPTFELFQGGRLLLCELVPALFSAAFAAPFETMSLQQNIHLHVKV